MFMVIIVKAGYLFHKRIGFFDAVCNPVRRDEVKAREKFYKRDEVDQAKKRDKIGVIKAKRKSLRAARTGKQIAGFAALFNYSFFAVVSGFCLP